MSTQDTSSSPSPDSQEGNVDMPTILGFWEGLSKADKGKFKKLGVAGVLALASIVGSGFVQSAEASGKSPASQTEVGNVSTAVKGDVEKTLNSEKIFGVPGDDMSIPE